MNDTEFFTALGEAAPKFKWKLIPIGGSQEDDCIRGKLRGLRNLFSGYYFCPVTAIAYARGKGRYSSGKYIAAGRSVGLSDACSHTAATSADGNTWLTSYSATVRQRMRKALGLYKVA